MWPRGVPTWSEFHAAPVMIGSSSSAAPIDRWPTLETLELVAIRLDVLCQDGLNCRSRNRGPYECWVGSYL
jgi:hypothetical protein